MTKQEHVTWWMAQLTYQLDNFMASPLGSAKDGLIALMEQYRDAVKFNQIEPPRICRKF